jgi:hypothetical protein
MAPKVRKGAVFVGQGPGLPTVRNPNDVGAGPDNRLVTEAGDTILTEDDDILVTES